MQLLEQKAHAMSAQQEKAQPKKGILFVRSDKPPVVQEEKTENPDEIDLDDDEDSGDDDAAVAKEDITIQKKVIPDQVFGGVKQDSDNEND